MYASRALKGRGKENGGGGDAVPAWASFLKGQPLEQGLP
jgi:hypothetical protein